MYLHNWYSPVLFYYPFSHDVPRKLETNGSFRGVYLIVLCNMYREYFMESAGVRIRNQTSDRSERVRFLIQKQLNECINTVQSTFHVVLCLLYTQLFVLNAQLTMSEFK